MKNRANNSLSTLVNGGIINLNNLFKPIEESFRKIDKDMFLDTFGKVKDSFFTNSINFANDLKEIFKDVKDTNKVFEYIVDFDKDKEKINYEIEDGDLGKELRVTIKSNDGLSTTVKYISIPKDCDLHKLIVRYNKDEKKEVFIIPKCRHHYSHKKKNLKNHDKNNNK